MNGPEGRVRSGAVGEEIGFVERVGERVMWNWSTVNIMVGTTLDIDEKWEAKYWDRSCR